MAYAAPLFSAQSLYHPSYAAFTAELTHFACVPLGKQETPKAIARRIAVLVYNALYKHNPIHQDHAPEALLEQLYNQSAAVSVINSANAKHAIWPFTILLEQFSHSPYYNRVGEWPKDEVKKFLRSLDKEKGSGAFQEYFDAIIQHMEQGHDVTEALQTQPKTACLKRCNNARAYAPVTQLMPATR